MASKKSEDVNSHRWVEHGGTWRYLAPGVAEADLDAPADDEAPAES